MTGSVEHRMHVIGAPGYFIVHIRVKVTSMRKGGKKIKKVQEYGNITFLKRQNIKILI